MRKSLVLATLLILAFTPSSGRAEQSVEDRAFAAALETRLKMLELEKSRCGDGISTANQQAWETLDRTERRYNRDSRGGLTSREKLELGQAQSNIDSATDAGVACANRIETERTNIKALLLNPERLRQESDRLRSEFRQELLVLVTEARAASTTLSARRSYGEFVLKMDAVEKRLRLIRAKYAIPLSRGDHKALKVPISGACNALYAAVGDWKQLSQADQEVTGMRAAVARAAKWEATIFEGRLRAAQLKQTEAPKRLADQTETTLALIQEATGVAGQEEESKMGKATP